MPKVMETTMAVCTFDNPATMCRECWQDQELVCSYDFILFALPDAPGETQPIPGRYLFFGANIGPIIKGQIVGDQDAIHPDSR